MVMLVVIPFLDERAHLDAVLASLEAQRRPPDRLLLVDDGSTDGSAQLAAAFAQPRSHVTVLRRPPRPSGVDRLAAASELSAFQWAIEQVDGDWDVVAKLDADVQLPPCALAELERELEAEPRLGIVGTFLSEERPGLGLTRIAIAEGHVHGATKFYRRACWEQIAPLPAILGWDTIDELRARRAGWQTRSVALPGGDPLHLRPRGSYDGALRAHRRWGACAYAFGEAPLVASLQALRQMGDRPRVVGGASYGLGYALAALRGAPRAEPELRAYVRAEQRRRLRRRLRSAAGGAPR